MTTSTVFASFLLRKSESYGWQRYQNCPCSHVIPPLNCRIITGGFAKEEKIAEKLPLSVDLFVTEHHKLISIWKYIACFWLF